MTPNPELPLDLAHLDDLRERIVQADEAIVSFVCLRVQLAREELAYRRYRDLPEWDRVFQHREETRVFEAIRSHAHPLTSGTAFEVARWITSLVRSETCPVDDGRYDPNTTDLGY